MRTVAASLLGLLLAVGSARADEAEAVRARSVALSLSDEATAQLVAAVRRAAEAGVPEASVSAKVLEGLAKGVPPERIAAAADDLTRRLQAGEAALRAAGASVATPERRAVLERLAIAAGALGPEGLAALGEAARGAEASALVGAAQQAAELQRRGVPAADALPALGAAARSLRREQIDRVSRLFDDYRAEGGSDPRAFLEEVQRRAERRHGLDDLVDHFEGRADPLNRIGPGTGHEAREKPGKANPSGRPNLEKPGRSGSAHGLDLQSPSRREKDCASGKKRNGCK